jgi:hypothetical protein
MRTIGLTTAGYRRNLKQWIELSLHRQIPISLLLLSRPFSITERWQDTTQSLRSAISSMEAKVVEEVVLDKAAELDPNARIKAYVRAARSPSARCSRACLVECVDVASACSARLLSFRCGCGLSLAVYVGSGGRCAPVVRCFQIRPCRRRCFWRRCLWACRCIRSPSSTASNHGVSVPLLRLLRVCVR